ncbi:hypothetical protein ACIU3Q_005506 [Salmonella enterica subsp. enterica serovar Kokomlemle]
MNDKTYNFEKVNINTALNPEDLAYALMASYAVLATMVVGDSEEKQEMLYGLFDKLIEQNQDSTCPTEIAAIAQYAQFAIRKATEASAFRATKDPSDS